LQERVVRRVRGCNDARARAVVDTFDARGRPVSLSEPVTIGSLALACGNRMLLLTGPEAGW
jgi:hypothetical protein